MPVNNKYMELALSLGFSRMGRTSPNPAVGAVIVNNNKIVSSGFTSEYGKDHAEVDAIKKASGHDLNGCEMYVSLEPCSHFGKTPPCVNAIIDSGIKKVYIPILDPNPEVAGRGVAELKNGGVQVEFLHDMTSAASDLIRPFKKYILRGKTFILNKSAMTLDGRIADHNGNSKWISSEVSRLIVHRLRSRVDAVIVGKRTFEKDSPLLNSRLNDFLKDSYGFLENFNLNIAGRENFFLRKLISEFDNQADSGKQPLKVVIGIPSSVTGNEDFFKSGNYIIYENHQKTEDFFSRHTALKNELNIVKTESDGSEQVSEICSDLASRGIMFSLLEGGGSVSGAFYEASETDQVMYFISPKIFGSGTGIVNYNSDKEFSRFQDISAVLLGDDLIYNAYREKYNFEMM